MAAGWLQQQGFTVLHRNWCYYHYEVDIIATRQSVLHFIEVKTRRTATWGQPEESVSRKKMTNLLKCAERFQQLFPQWKRIQYDIVSIDLSTEEMPEFFFIEDVYL